MSSFVRRDFLRFTADLFAIEPEYLVGHNRRLRFSKARFAMYKALRMRGTTFSQIGRWCERDHSTVRHGVERAEYYMERDETFRKRVMRLVEFCAPKDDTCN